jgi:hypothetical protein
VSPCKHPEADRAIACAVRLRSLSVVKPIPKHHFNLSQGFPWGRGHTETDAAGNTVTRERRTTINHAMKTCRRAWNVATRRNPGKVRLVNPFAQMGLEGSDRETPTATFAELQTFRTKAIEMGLPSLATAALIAWEWLQREVDVFATFDAAHYRRDVHEAIAYFFENLVATG